MSSLKLWECLGVRVRSPCPAIDRLKFDRSESASRVEITDGGQIIAEGSIDLWSATMCKRFFSFKYGSNSEL